MKTFFLLLSLLVRNSLGGISVGVIGEVYIGQTLPTIDGMYYQVNAAPSSLEIKSSNVNDSLTITVAKDLPYYLGALYIWTNNWEKANIGRNDSARNFICYNCNKVFDGPFWTIHPYGASIMAGIANGSLKSEISSSYTLTVTSKFFEPINVTVPVKFDLSSAFKKWTPSMGAFGGKYKFTTCPPGHYVNQISGSQVDAPGGGGLIFSGLYITCTDGKTYYTQEGNPQTSKMTLVDCTSDSHMPISGAYGNIGVGSKGFGLSGLRFICANRTKTSWAGIEDEDSKYFYSCPSGQLMTGTHVYGEGSCDNLAIQCSPVLFKLDTNSTVDAIMDSVNPSYIIPESAFTITMGYGSIAAVSINLTINQLSSSSAWIETKSAKGIWEPSTINTVTFGDIKRSSVRLRIAPNSVLNNTNVELALSATSVLKQTYSPSYNLKVKVIFISESSVSATTSTSLQPKTDNMTMIIAIASGSAVIVISIASICAYRIYRRKGLSNEMYQKSIGKSFTSGSGGNLNPANSYSVTGNPNVMNPMSSDLNAFNEGFQSTQIDSPYGLSSQSFSNSQFGNMMASNSSGPMMNSTGQRQRVMSQAAGNNPIMLSSMGNPYILSSTISPSSIGGRMQSMAPMQINQATLYNRNEPNQATLINRNEANQATLYNHHDQTVTNTTIGGSYLAIPGYLRLNPNTDLLIEESLGKGGTAAVYRAKIINPMLITKHGVTDAAIKMMPSADRDIFNFEVALMGSIPPSPNIVLFLGYVDNPSGIIMKKYVCSLKDIIFNLSLDFSAENSKHFAADVAKGICHLHAFDIVHFDIKPANVLIEEIGANETRCVISDFGCAKPVGTDLTSTNERLVAGLSIPEKAGITIPYCSPEMIKTFRMKNVNCEDIHKKVDVYAYGISLLEIVLRRRAWESRTGKQIEEGVLQGERPKLPSEDGDPFIAKMFKIIRSAWDENPLDRPTMQSILQDLK